ncbi:MAG: heavy metal-binding domain-containing protein, partial [Candidatus Dormibacteria bacterium]
MRNPGSRELRRRQARLETQQRTMVRERAQVPKRSEVMQRGGMLEGFAPSLVTRVALLSLLLSVVLIALAVVGLLVELGQKDLFLGVVVVVVAVLISGITMSVTAPAWLTARGDRKAQARSIQGQLVGASRISPTPTLATLAINVGRNVEIPQFTEALYDARELAMSRMQAEAEQLQAEGIVGVQLLAL